VYYSIGVAYILWLSCIFGFCDIHRFFAGKPLTGLLCPFTLGLLGFGQLLDIIHIPGMIALANLRAPSPLATENTNTVNVNSSPIGSGINSH
jgi:hypothetical protein